MSQREAIERVISRNKAGVTVDQIVAKADVPKGNVLSHIATLRHKYKLPIKTERRELKNGAKKVFFVMQKAYRKAA